MEKKELPEIWLSGVNITEETKTLISSLPSDKDCLGKLYNYQGYWYHDSLIQGVFKFHKGFKPQDNDIILASFPKSGTTWLKSLTFALLTRSKYRSSEDLHPLLSNNPHDLVPFLEVDLYKESSNPDLTKLPSSSSSSPRVFSTHMPLHTLQVALKDSPCKIVYMCRDVKDVIVSQFYFTCGLLKKEVNKSILESLFESFCRGAIYYGPIWDHVLSYWRGSLEDSKHVLFMRYEEMKEEPCVQVKRLAEFLGYPFSEEEEQKGSVEKILELCSLSNLKSLEINKTGKFKDVLDNSSFFRKGEVGDYKNHLTPEMVNKIDMIIAEKLKGSGLKF